MKTLLSALVIFFLIQFANGCGLLPASKVDGSQSYYDAHPEQNNPPGYFRPQDEDGN